MKLFSSIILFLAFAISCEAAFFILQDGGKKKKKKGREEEKYSHTSSPDKEQQVKLNRLFLEAEKAKVIEDWDNAIKNYREVLSIDSKNHNAHFQLAQIYSNLNKLAEAEKEAAEAVKLDDTNKWYLTMLANVYMDEGKTKEASETFKKLIEKFPNNPDNYFNLGFLLSKSGQFENAIKIYDQFEKNFGLDEQVIMEKKNLYLRLNKFNNAVDEVHKLVNEFPNDVNYMLMEAELYRANRMKEKATEAYKKILEIEPDNPHALLALADLGMKDGNDLQSLENIKKIFENPKTGIDTKIKILFPYVQFWEQFKEKKQDAFELAEILTRVHPDEAKSFAIQGDLYFLDEQPDKALGSYLKALELNKDVLQVWQQVLVIYNSKRDWDNLEKTASEAAELFPNQAVIYLFKGGAEQQKKDYEKALKSFSHGEKMSADNDKLRSQFFANLGDVFHSLNRMQESDSAYDRSLKLDPENAYVLNNYAYYLSLRKVNLEKAKQMSAYSNKLEPANSSFLDTYAWILFQLNDFSGAKEWQEKALKAGGDQSGTILEHYGDILYQLGKKDEALEYWKKAKELGTDSGTIERKISEGRYIE